MTLIQLSDLHLFENPQAVYKDRVPYEQVKQALDHVKQTVVDPVVVISGDLVSEETPKTYQLLSQLLNHYDYPIYLIPGNHDDQVLLKQYVQGKHIQHGGHFELNNWLIILLDSSTPGQTLGGGVLSAEELMRLKHLLTTHSHQPVLIFIHHPPLVIGAKWFEKICLENKEAFQEVIKGHKNIQAIAFGHAHAQLATKMNDQLYLCAPSTLRQINHFIDERSTYTDQSGGYNWFKLGRDNQLQFGSVFL